MSKLKVHEGSGLLYIAPEKVELPFGYGESSVADRYLMERSSYGYTTAKALGVNLLDSAVITDGEYVDSMGVFHSSVPEYKLSSFLWCYVDCNGHKYKLSPFTNQFVRLGRPKLRIRLLKKVRSGRYGTKQH